MHESTDQFKTVFNLSPFPMILYTLADGLVLEVNDRYLQTFGLCRHNVVDHLVFRVAEMEGTERFYSALLGQPLIEEAYIMYMAGDTRLFFTRSREPAKTSCS